MKLETPIPAAMLPDMSIAELKHLAENLSAKERTWLRAYLSVKKRASVHNWKIEMARRRRRLAAGQGISSSEYNRPTC
jgi:hypothetical protein